MSGPAPAVEANSGGETRPPVTSGLGGARTQAKSKVVCRKKISFAK